MIEIKSIDKFYGTGKNRHQALKKIDLCFRKTEFVAILGPSGSGKTTLLNVIGGLDHYDSGDLVINNISTKDYTDRDWDSYRNHSVGFIFQSYNLIQHQTILSNVEMALTISGVSGREKKERAVRALTAVGLGEYLNKKPNQLSGGQMQRVAIARALVNNPSVILADEPTGALDSKTSVQVMDILKEAAKDRLIIMVTHNPKLAKQYATRIITLKDGEIISDSDPYKPEEKKEKAKSKNMGHSSMNVFTALSLSFHNLWTKRKRTLLTSFAGSIGIIGIALIIALSSGVNVYIEKQEANMSYQYPLLVETLNMDLTSVLSDFEGELMGQDSDHVEVLGFLEKLFAVLDTNDVGAVKEYIEKPENDISKYGTVEYIYNVQPQIYVEYDDKIKRVCPDSTLDSLGIPVSNIDTSLISSAVSTNMFYCMPSEKSLYLDRYNLKAGHWPENPDECIIVLTNSGKITDYLLYIMGLKDPSKVDEFIKDFIHGEEVETEQLDKLTFQYGDFLGISFKVIDSYSYYGYDKEFGGWRDRTGDTNFMKNLVKNGRDLRIVGVVQPKPEYGTGVLWPGINYPFSLLEETIERAKESDIVKAQLADPKTDVFTNTPFDQMDGNKNLDPLSLINVDTDVIWESVKLDTEAIQKHFLEGADFDSVKTPLPQIDLESYFDTEDILNTVRKKIEEDLPSLIEDAGISDKDVLNIAKSIAGDFIQFMRENGYLDIKNLLIQLETYFSSDEFTSLVRNWAENLDPDNISKEYIQEQVDLLTDLIKESLDAFLESHGFPSVPYLKNCIEKYRKSGRAEHIAAAEISNILQKTDTQEKLEDYVRNTIQPLIKAKIAAGMKLLEQDIKEQSDAITAKTRKDIEACVKNGLSAVIDHIPECISADTDKLLSAFSMRMDIKELSDLLLSFTNLSKSSVSKNLNRLGYVEMSHPKSIQIFPNNFEDKDSVIEILKRYNERSEIMNDKKHTVSYTDTLGTVISTITRIISIITEALMATVAVSLIVSSIMIGVITYISVLERRKEIGILRAMGASKHNISQIFNAETFITGLLSGSIGVGLGYLLLIPLNLILHKATDISDIWAFLPAKYALFLVIISIVLTVIGGIIPSYNASKSDPVESLRNE